MLANEKIIIDCFNAKADSFSTISEYVHLSVRSYERDKAYNKVKKMVGFILDAYEERQHAEKKTVEKVNPLTMSEESVRATLSGVSQADSEKVTEESIEAFLVDREEVNDLDKEISTFSVTMGDFKALQDVDRLFITLQAHTALSGIKLDEKILDGYDWEKTVSDYYRDGSTTKGREDMKALFNSLVGKEGDLFKAVKVRKGDITAEDFRNFCARFRGTAKRESHTVDGVTHYGKFDYYKTENVKKIQVSAITDYLAILLTRDNGLEVIDN